MNETRTLTWPPQMEATRRLSRLPNQSKTGETVTGARACPQLRQIYRWPTASNPQIPTVRARSLMNGPGFGLPQLNHVSGGPRGRQLTIRSRVD